MRDRYQRVVALTKRVRTAQRNYYRERTVELLHAAKGLGRELDHLLVEFDEHGEDSGHQLTLYRDET